MGWLWWIALWLLVSTALALFVGPFIAHGMGESDEWGDHESEGSGRQFGEGVPDEHRRVG